ncbi:unnamed protein product [Prorocentrum cordatum]|uniref:RNA helicase n=2 Tax=Prorocentrum cordatum TaxID=2364126 RepID=A0ABN9PQM4_9DINO|nr:unnamed protein product [Polarella glacialis]
MQSSSSNCEYTFEDQTLKVTCTQVQEASSFLQDRATWYCAAWNSSKLKECVVSRNFAQNVPHHAAGSSVIVSELTFKAKLGGQYRDIVWPTGHRMSPEVFSVVPDLSEWYQMDTDVAAYAQIWSRIRLCQVHAGALAGSTYTQRMPALKLKWYPGQGGHFFECQLQRRSDADEDKWIQREDMVILRCSTQKGEAVFYGLVQESTAKTTQFKTKMCDTTRCTGQHCPYAHSQEELQGCCYTVKVKLSNISLAAYLVQRGPGQLLSFADPDESYNVQFISVPLAEKKNLEMLNNMGIKAANLKTTSPMNRYLTSARSPEQVRQQQEMRPLASTKQVDDALDGHFCITSGTGVNKEQLEGVKRGLQCDFSMVQGPPGTGKTTFLVRLVVALLNLETDRSREPSWEQARSKRTPAGQQKEQEPGRILVCAPSNFAADEIVSRLARSTNIPPRFITRVYARAIEMAHGSRYKGGALVPLGKHSDMRFDIRSELEEFGLHHKTKHSADVRPLEGRLPPDSIDPVAQKQYDEAHERGEVEVLRRSRVVVTTCTSAFLHTALTKGKVTKMTRTVPFATVIVDEAAQASEPDVVLPSLLAEDRVVVVGDHKQLGPVIPEKNMCKAYVNALEMPFIERILKGGAERARANTSLNRQYRMAPTIRSFPSKQFYSGILQDELPREPPSLPRGVWPKEKENVVFIDCQTPHTFGLVVEDGRRSSMSPTLVEGNTSIKNDGEVLILVEVVWRLLNHNKTDPSHIGIITPYRAQQQQIREKLLERIGYRAKSIAVGTVHALQGSERDFIILSFVRSTSEELVSQAALPSASDTVVSVEEKNVALRQICESNLGIVSNPKLLNVSLTRARHGLACIGNKAVLSMGSTDFFDLIEDLSERKCVLSQKQFMNRPRP